MFGWTVRLSNFSTPLQENDPSVLTQYSSSPQGAGSSWEHSFTSVIENRFRSDSDSDSFIVSYFKCTTFRKREMLFFLGSSTVVESQHDNKMQKNILFLNFYSEIAEIYTM